ncbi:MAG TPA: ATP-dependent DNA helicase UvrD2 [Kineosporiaceae bacterium]|nr:ATP-dependent DNA helicase UvrD2 [Kineosporiaceae bacterium]
MTETPRDPHSGLPIGEPLTADGMLAALDPEQREVVLALDGPVCVLAGAGTDKTRAITHRIAYGAHAGLYTPQQVLAVTFTARAAGEMRTRLRALGVGGVQARTFHAAALRQLGYFFPRVVGGRPPEILEHKSRMIADAASRLRLTVDRTAVRDLAAEVEWSKVSLLTPETYAGAARKADRGEPGGFPPETIARLITVYEEAKTDRGVIDFEDVLLLTAGIIEAHPEVATAIRGQYRHFVVDEYQDVSALQQRLLEQWLGGRDELCVVGDPSQTIYSFTGASPVHLLKFQSRYANARVVRLVRDYRSTPQVVYLANRLLAKRTGSGPAPLRLIAQREAGPEPTLTSYDDDVAEAAAVAKRIKQLVAKDVRPREIAVLFRTNGQSEQLEQALSDLGLAYVLRGGERFWARKEVREALMLLRGAARAGNDELALGEETRGVLAAAGWSVSPPSAGGALRERWESLQALAALADEFAASRPEATLSDLVAELDERLAAQHAPAVEGITLASLHAAKGLEWDAVFLVGLSEGLMPISFAEGWEAVEEERRLLYVGITRARIHLQLSWSRSRTPGGRASRSPSRFLEGIFPEAAKPIPVAARETRSRDSARKRSTVPGCRVCGGVLSTARDRKVGRCSSCPSTYDEATFDRLREWRSQTAAAAKLPAYVVFTDATLVAIAETMPADEGELARIPGVGQVKKERYGDAVLALLTTDAAAADTAWL